MFGLFVFGCMHMPGLINTESVESSSNKCKNYLLNIYWQDGNFLNTI